MDEAEWLNSDDPAAMLHCLIAQSVPGHVDGLIPHTSDRKLRLFACAVARHLWSRLDVPSRDAVLAAERTADGEPIDYEAVRCVENARMDTGGYRSNPPSEAWRLCHMAYWALVGAEEHRWRFTNHTEYLALVPANVQASLLREIVGNPLRPVYNRSVGPSDFQGLPPAYQLEVIPENCLADPLVQVMAREAYEQRDFAELGALADRLEDMGAAPLCPSMLAHLRSPGPHVRGCWCLNLLLGKE